MPPSEIQDNGREIELIRLFGLSQDENRTRIGLDAFLEIDNIKIPFEIKSTTKSDVTTARDVNLDHINRWKKMNWLVGIYNKEAVLQHTIYGSPKDMAEWIAFVEQDIQRGLKISKMLVDRIDIAMINEVFGDKQLYTLKEASFVFKKLFTKKQYEDYMGANAGFTKEIMLEMFKKHNLHYLERGSSMNNPKIPRKIIKDWPIVKNKEELIRVVKEKNELS